MTFDVQETRRICEAATTGELYRTGNAVRRKHDPAAILLLGLGGSANDLEFHVHARTALPAALDVIEAMTAREAELLGEVEQLREALRLAQGDLTPSERRSRDFIDGTFDARQDNA